MVISLFFVFITVMLNGCLYFTMESYFLKAAFCFLLFEVLFSSIICHDFFFFFLTTLALFVSAYKVESLTLIFRGLN